MIDFIKEVTEALNRKKNKVVTKRIPATEKWQKKNAEMRGIIADISVLTGKLKALKDSFWSEIQLELNCFDDMSYNEETKEVEIYESDKQKSVKSPYIKN